jgi:nitroreductase
MHVSDAIAARRAYRSLSPEPISEETLDDLARAASLAPSCYNKQPWRFVFVRLPEQLSRLREALSEGNEWARNAPCIAVVLGRREDDCLIDDRDYWTFDIGLATAFLILRATELALVAHPIAGFDARTVRAVVGIPDDVQVVTLVILARRATGILPNLSAGQRAAEMQRPVRRPLDAVRSFDSYREKLRQF